MLGECQHNVFNNNNNRCYYGCLISQVFSALLAALQLLMLCVTTAASASVSAAFAYGLHIWSCFPNLELSQRFFGDLTVLTT